jgi:hypothetical protein
VPVTPTLEQVGTLKELCCEELTEEEEEHFPLKEYRVHGKPQSLKAFLDLFLLENGGYDKHHAIWIPECDVFVCIDQGRVQRDSLPRAYREGVFKIALACDKHLYDVLSVFSSTVEQALLVVKYRCYRSTVEARSMS